MQFTYRALTTDGKLVSGRLGAENRQAALEMIGRNGLRAVALESAGVHAGDTAGAGDDSRPGRKSVELFMRQAANLLGAGVSLSRTLEIIAREASRPALGRRWKQVHDDVVGGASLAEALARWPKTFPPVYTAMVRAGETGGFLELVLEQIADFCAREQEVMSRLKTALIYPAILVFAAVAVLFFLMIYFIPRFSEIFADFGAALPRLTSIVINASDRLAVYGFPAALVLVFGVFAARRVLAEKKARLAWENFLFRLPLFGPLAVQFSLARFCRMLGTLLKAGVPLLTALRVARGSLGRLSFEEAVGRVTEKVRDGSGLARGMGAEPVLFPPSVVEIVGVAEESGTLDRELVRLAESAEKELDRKMGVTVAVMEPALLFIMAAIIGLIVVSMLLPIFTLQDFIN